MRLNALRPEYQGRVAVRSMAFPLELGDHAPPPRDILEQEWWLAALQEPQAAFRPFTGDFPTTTLPAFHAAKAAARQGEEAADRYDLRVRTAFFADSANIGSPAVLVDLARELGLDVARFERDLDAPAVQAEVLAERRQGQEQFGVRGTPTLVLPDGSKPPLAAGRPAHARPAHRLGPAAALPRRRLPGRDAPDPRPRSRRSAERRSTMRGTGDFRVGATTARVSRAAKGKARER